MLYIKFEFWTGPYWEQLEKAKWEQTNLQYKEYYYDYK